MIEEQTCKLRFATKKDVFLIWDLIHELAVYEKLSDKITATVQDLEESLFAENPCAEIIIAEVQDKAVGYALFFHNYSTFLGKRGIYLEDIFVLPEFRGRNVGKSLFTHVAKIGIQRNCCKMEWTVLNWNTPALNFYQTMGAQAMNGWTIHLLMAQDLQKIAENE